MQKYKKKKWTPTKEELEQYKKNIERVKDMSLSVVNDIFENYSTDIEVILDYVQFAAKFYQYSPNNVALILKQLPNAVFVQSSLSWKKMGAFPKKGTHGAKILVPQTKKYIIADKEDILKCQTISSKYRQTIESSNLNRFAVGYAEATKEIKKKAELGVYEITSKLVYGIGTVFDIGQTTFPKEKYPLLFNMGHDDKKSNYFFHAISEYINYRTIFDILIMDLESVSLRGYFNPNRNLIVISEQLDDTEKLKTTLHELGHAFYHNIYVKDNLNKSEIQKEIEADVFSLMCLSMFDLEINDSLKRHLKNHYDKYLNEIRKTDLEDEVIKKNVREVVQNVMKNFNEFAKDINDYLKGFSLEKVLEREKEEDFDIEV